MLHVCVQLLFSVLILTCLGASCFMFKFAVSISVSLCFMFAWSIVVTAASLFAPCLYYCDYCVTSTCLCFVFVSIAVTTVLTSIFVCLNEPFLKIGVHNPLQSKESIHSKNKLA